MSRIRTISQAYNLIRFEDPETGLTEYMIRKLVLEGKIPSIRSGNRFYVDVDVVQNYIANKTGIKLK